MLDQLRLAIVVVAVVDLGLELVVGLLSVVFELV